MREMAMYKFAAFFLGISTIIIIAFKSRMQFLILLIKLFLSIFFRNTCFYFDFATRRQPSIYGNAQLNTTVSFDYELPSKAHRLVKTFSVWAQGSATAVAPSFKTQWPRGQDELYNSSGGHHSDTPDGNPMSCEKKTENVRKRRSRSN